MDKRRRDLDSVRRYAHWRTKVENEGAIILRHGDVPEDGPYSHGLWANANGQRTAFGPVVELELGYRTATYFLHAPSSGGWVRADELGHLV